MRVAIVGAGITGATLAYSLARHCKVVVFEAMPHVGGMAYTERDPETGIMMHRYGPHIFHTSNMHVRRFMEQFGRWRKFDLRMKSWLKGKIYSAPPINLHTINQVYGACWAPAEARDFLQRGRVDNEASNFEEAARNTIGPDLYSMFLENYTRKQWGREPRDLPMSIFERVPIRFNYNDSKYPVEDWQAIPEEGYTAIIERMLKGVTTLTSCPVDRTLAGYDHVFYTGPVDRWFGYNFGRLPYRTLDFVHETRDVRDAQGCAVMAFPGEHPPVTRRTEHKHFTPWENYPKTILTQEYAREAGPKDMPFYPVRLATPGDERLVQEYERLANQEKGVTFVGRLATYRYIDMDQAVLEARECARKFLKQQSL